MTKEKLHKLEILFDQFQLTEPMREELLNPDAEFLAEMKDETVDETQISLIATYLFQNDSLYKDTMAWIDWKQCLSPTLYYSSEQLEPYFLVNGFSKEQYEEIKQIITSTYDYDNSDTEEGYAELEEYLAKNNKYLRIYNNQSDGWGLIIASKEFADEWTNYKINSEGYSVQTFRYFFSLDGNGNYRKKTINLGAADYHKGVELKNKGEYSQAIKYFTEALKNGYNKTNEQKSNTYWQIAYCLEVQNQDEAAIEIYKKALEFAPKEAGLYYSMGCSYAKLKKHEIAIEWMDKALAIKENHLSAKYNKGIYLYVLEKDQEALKVFKNIGCEHIDYPLVRHYMWKIYYSLGNLKKALELIEKDTMRPYEAQFYKGLIFYSDNKDKEAIIAYTKAIEISGPNDDMLFYNRGLSYQMLKQYDKAKSNYIKALEINPNYKNAKEALEDIENTINNQNNLWNLFKKQ